MLVHLVCISLLKVMNRHKYRNEEGVELERKVLLNEDVFSPFFGVPNCLMLVFLQDEVWQRMKYQHLESGSQWLHHAVKVFAHSNPLSAFKSAVCLRGALVCLYVCGNDCLIVFK